ncbi:hypothetical protein LJK87_44770 [Paenibacillus sp. P25]|nr:hypothetical protein LJK87_44770 [Paenibacillus sp. P25]
MLNERQTVSLSKLMSKMLRHSPEAFGLSLDSKDGSCPLNEPLDALRRRANGLL